MSESQGGAIKSGDIVIFHLTSGNAVIGKFLGATEDGMLILEKPCDIVAKKNPKTGILEVGFSPFLSIAQILPPFASVPLREDHVLMPRLAPKDLTDSYLRSTTGIQIASTLPNA